jgi:hypothetical protein
MPTVKEAARKERAYKWLISQFMEEKEKAAKERRDYLITRQAGLEKVYQEYLELYKKHIQPIYPQVQEFIDNSFELQKIDHFIQGQEARSAKFQKLPYAGKSEAGKKPKPQSKDQVNIKLFKQLPADKMEELLRKAGIK